MSTDTDALVAFLKARLDEEEADASACPRGPWIWEDRGYMAKLTPDEVPYNAVLVVDANEHAPDDAFWSDTPAARHIVRHDPARVLRDVAADRKLIASYLVAEELWDKARHSLNLLMADWQTGSTQVTAARWDVHSTTGRLDGLRYALAIRAGRFADHEGYQEIWRP